MTAARASVMTNVSSSSLVVHHHRGRLEIVDELANEWRDLCSEATDDQPFYRPEWIRAYARAFLPHARFLLITVRLDGRLCLLLPLVEETSMLGGVPVRRLRAPVNAHPGRFDFVRSAGPEGDAAIRVTWDYLEGLGGWDVLEFAYTPEGGTVSRLAAAARANGFRAIQIPELPNPYVHVPSTSEGLMQMPPNSKLRSQLRQTRHRLEGQGAVKFSRLDTADREALDRFYGLEASGWKGQEGSAIACRSETRQFYDEIAASAARLGYFSLYMLELEGHLIAAHFSLTHRDRCYSPKVAYDENFKEFAPGHLIIGEILRDCAARSIRIFDITGPNDDWKMKWTSEARPVNHHFIFKGPVGRLAHAIRFRLKPAVARLLPRPKRPHPVDGRLGQQPASEVSTVVRNT